VRRPRLPDRLGLEGLRGDRRRLRPRPRRGPARLREAARADLHALRPRHRRGTTRTSTASAPAELVGQERFDEVERVSLELYRFASEYAAERGILLADTKFELGLDEEGRLVLGDEVFTPDSSRFWPADEYEPGRPAAVLRQAVRARLLREPRLGQDAARPELPEDVVAGTRARYVEAFERLTGIEFDAYLRAPDAVLG
jgi:hypothetical protein